MGDEYEMYVHRKWIENCLERDAWGESVLQKADYVSENIEWLRDSFYSDMRVDKDGFLNLC
jgi:hypothetical protein